MAGIREVISQEEGDGLRDAVLLSTKPASDLLGQLYSKAVFAGRHVQVHEPAPEGDLDELFKTFAKVSPTLKRTDTTRKALEADAAYQKFVKGHVKFGLYKTTIMKCNDPDCPYHKPVRMPKAVWDTLTWFPDATLDANSKTSGWRSFANSWGKPTTEKDRSDATADDGTLISGSEDADQDESEVAPDELSDDEYEIEEIIELRENSKPMQWLVKWKCAARAR